MTTKRKARGMVRAWAYMRNSGCERIQVDENRGRAADDRRRAIRNGYSCGPIVAISVPAPALVKKGKNHGR